MDSALACRTILFHYLSDPYAHVATLDVEPYDEVQETLDLVFDLAQHGRGDWTAGDHVRWVAGPGTEVRSLYVGDAVVLESSGRRSVFEVGLAGFRRIDVAADQVPPPRVVPPTPREWEAEQRALQQQAPESGRAR